MTRYTNMRKKTHVKADDAMVVNPLKPKGKQSAETNGSQDPIEKQSNSRKMQRKGNRKEKNKKAPYSNADRKKRKMRCLKCKQMGHSVNECPSQANGAVGICYNCGSTEHALKHCKKPRNPDEPLPYAKCFVCNEQGHLSKQCPKNENGIYPNGGACHKCGSKAHLAKDCSVNVDEDGEPLADGTTTVGKIDSEQGADDDDYHIF
ncbi:hypothetical protein VTP01DRAFT_4508 [Rhizomucor pusillus]|uniref:uncharacterized protein n=1 Tax=Rhizomucor pusillus TaxID=4840 RepID=UPI0037439D6C